MKKLFTTLLCAMLTLCAFAQLECSDENVNTHLKFKGIPIDGAPSEFARQLGICGFVGCHYTNTSNGDKYVCYKGFFAGYKDCKIAIKSSNASDNLVCEIVVILPQEHSRKALYNTYFSLKEMLTRKYGEPTSIKERGKRPKWRNSDYDKFSEITQKHNQYYSVFSSTKDGVGTIHLEIKDYGYIGIHYEDLENSSKKEEQVLNDL